MLENRATYSFLKAMIRRRKVNKNQTSFQSKKTHRKWKERRFFFQFWRHALTRQQKHLSEYFIRVESNCWYRPNRNTQMRLLIIQKENLMKRIIDEVLSSLTQGHYNFNFNFICYFFLSNDSMKRRIIKNNDEVILLNFAWVHEIIKRLDLSD